MHLIVWWVLAIVLVYRAYVVYCNWLHNVIIEKCIDRLNIRMAELDVCPSHGINHARAVLKNAYLIMSDMTWSGGWSIRLWWHERLAVCLAALLHDADDRKIPGYAKGMYPNAISIMHDISPHTRALVLRMITLTSASGNGDTLPHDIKSKPWLVVPRLADRLEAIGRVGLDRCHIYTLGIKRPLYTARTMRAKDLADLRTRVAPLSRWVDYVDNDGKSESMMDHIYDKLLHLFVAPAPFVSQRFNKRICDRVQILIDVALEFGRTGHIDSDRVEAIVHGKGSRD